MKINYIKLLIVNYIYILILEFVFKFLVLGTNDLGYVYIMFFSCPFALLITFISSLFKNSKINRVISIIFWLLLYLCYIAEAVYFSFYKSIFGIGGLEYGGQVMEFFDTITTHIIANMNIILIGLVPLILLVVLSIRKVILHSKFYLKESIVLFVGSLVLCFTVLQFNYSNNLVKNLFFNRNDILESTSYFGLLSSFTLDAYKTFTNFEEKVEYIENEDIISETIHQDVYDDDSKIEYNITDIDFDSLIENEKDSTLKTMHKYFSSKSGTNKNEYTGIFAGKNVIFITAEGFSTMAVNEEYTPTLYKLANSSFVFTNYYQPIFNCSTSDGEFINMLSLLPGIKTCSMTATPGVYFPYNLGNIMKDYGYKTYAFHGWTYTYYNRDETYPNLGYTYYGYDRFKTGYKYALKNIKYSWPTSDIDVVNSSYSIYGDSSDNFVAYYMSISGHLNYNFTGGNAIALKNKDLVKDMNASSSIKAYMATQMEFDKSLEILLDDLEKSGKLENTVIVIAADHYPYGLSNSEIMEYNSDVKDTNFDLYKNTLIIYDASREEKVTVDKYVSSLDVLPTLLNMLGVQYDSRLLMGNDIFSDAEDLVIFNNKSWITSKGRYNYTKKTFESFSDEEVSDDYIKKINNIVSLKFQMSKLVISKDYYRKVLDK